ncbi:9555_t:CDS:2 [Ambispora leptoticha]|uniref:FAD synthase n=1 Tax=Ambispora leptoticha TaxID=144679 RepID=A0A9N9C820_9GLOM|nr:9555_t:CDS:2 [Ambispora leptoticha]
MQPLLMELAKIYEQVYSLAETPNSLQASVKHALEIIEEALNRYGTNGLALSFNGGKDCTVLLYLYSAALYKFSQKSGEKIPKIQSVYITNLNPFAEVDAFVEESIHRYRLDLIKVESPMKQALATYLENRPSVKGILVGNRRNDPYSERLSEFAPTDPGWPNFMRIHPILDWHYNQIWEFLQKLKVPYCSLYNIGYTSLGSTVNTRANPDLRNPNNPNGFDPAWKLTDESKERNGRTVEKYTIKTILSNSTTSATITNDINNEG